MAGLETIPAIVQRRDYDDVTRFVRQLVENIQREDLNDIDRAAGLVRLRELMQEELNAEVEKRGDKPWSRKVTWAKVGASLGYSRQRIHQLIQLLNLPDELRAAVRKGEMSERDTRIYQGLDSDQQRALFTAVTDGYVTSQEGKQVAQLLKKGQARSINAALRLVRAGDNEPKKRKQSADIGNQVRLERVQALLAHVRWQGMDSAEASLTYQLLQEIEIQVADLLHHFEFNAE